MQRTVLVALCALTLSGCAAPSSQADDGRLAALEGKQKDVEARLKALEELKPKVDTVEADQKSLGEQLGKQKDQLNELSSSVLALTRGSRPAAAQTPAEAAPAESPGESPVQAAKAVPEARAVTSGWKTNGTVGIKVSKLETIPDASQWTTAAAPFQRVGPSFDWAKPPGDDMGNAATMWAGFEKGTTKAYLEGGLPKSAETPRGAR